MNEATQDAEESVTTEKTASNEQSTAPQTEAGSQSAETGSSQQAESSEATPPAAAPEPAKPSEPRRVMRPASMAPPPPAQPTAAKEQAPAAPSSASSQADDDAASGDIDFGAILEQFEQEQTQFQQGDLVEGKIVGITDRGVLVDFGYKSEGWVPPEEFIGPDGQMTAKVGDSVEVVIRHIHSGDGGPQLSRSDALGRKVWDEIEQAYNSESTVTAKVIDKTKGGLRVEVNGIEAFLPGSQIDSRPIRSLDSYIGQELEARVIKFSRRRNNIVLSRKILTDEVVNAQKAETLSHIDVGYIVEGTIKNLTEYGAFVDIGGIDGLLHVTDMSWGRIHHPGDLFKVNDHIQVKVLKLDREKEKVSLGYKQLQPDPWSTVVEVYPVDTKLNGTVSSVTDYGVFVELEPGVEGLVHVSEISWARRAQSPKRIFHKGQQVEVQVLGVDTVEKRISLGMKQFQENPWDTVDIRYPVGAKIRGKVRNITDFGAFVELEEGIDGLVHVSDISWGKKIKHPKDLLKKDQEVEAVVTSIDKRNQRLSLSMKDLTPSAWEGFVATHRPGDTVKGKVSRFTNFGVFVELGDGLEGLCHISELSDDRVERPEDVAALGQELDFRILRIEPAEQKIGLSHRAVGKAGEEDSGSYADTRTFSSEAKGGMASLGELANLKFGNAAEAPAEEETKKDKKAKKDTQESAAADSGDAPAETAAETTGTDASNEAVSESTQEASSAGDPGSAEPESQETAGTEQPAEQSTEQPTEQSIDASATSGEPASDESEQGAA